MIVAAVWSAGAVTVGASAQDAMVVDAPPSESVSIGYKPAQSYDEFRLEELTGLARRSRNALIGTSAATVVGAVLWFPAAATQCYEVPTFDSTQAIRCTTGGKVMLGFGLPLFWGGLTGVLISGIMFGVRKGKLRRLKDKIARERLSGLRWDPSRSSFVF